MGWKSESAFFARNGLGQVAGENLAKRVYAGVGAACANDLDGLAAGDLAERVLKAPLNGTFAGLDLPAGEIRAIVADRSHNPVHHGRDATRFRPRTGERERLTRSRQAKTRPVGETCASPRQGYIF